MAFDAHDVAVFLLLGGMMYVILDMDESLLSALIRMVPYNEVADFFDGTGRGGRPKAHDDRWWEKTGRNLSIAVFSHTFRCRCVVLLWWMLYVVTYTALDPRHGWILPQCRR